MRHFLPALACVSVLLTSSAGLKAADPGPKAILIKAIKAHGGEEYLAKNQAAQIRTKGKLTLPGLGETDFTQQVSYMLPDKFKDNLELTINGQKINVLTMANGEKISIEANGKEVPTDDKIKVALKDAQQMLKASRLVPLVQEKGYELGLAGETKVEDKPAVGVRVTKKGQKDINLYFDKETSLLAKVEFRATDPMTGNEFNEERIIVAYEKGKDGAPQPKKVLVKHDGKTFAEAEVVEITNLEKLDDSEFKK